MKKTEFHLRSNLISKTKWAVLYHCEVLYHPTIHSSFVKLVLVLRQADVIQPA